MMDNIDTHHGLPRAVRRENIYMDVLEMYQENMEEILGEFPFRVKYENEKACDTGGVCRDMFSSFWEEAYLQHFDGSGSLFHLCVLELICQSLNSLVPFLPMVLWCVASFRFVLPVSSDSAISSAPELRARVVNPVCYVNFYETLPNLYK